MKRVRKIALFFLLLPPLLFFGEVARRTLIWEWWLHFEKHHTAEEYERADHAAGEFVKRERKAGHEPTPLQILEVQKQYLEAPEMFVRENK